MKICWHLNPTWDTQREGPKTSCFNSAAQGKGRERHQGVQIPKQFHELMYRYIHHTMCTSAPPQTPPCQHCMLAHNPLDPKTIPQKNYKEKEKKMKKENTESHKRNHQIRHKLVKFLTQRKRKEKSKKKPIAEPGVSTINISHSRSLTNLLASNAGNNSQFACV